MLRESSSSEAGIEAWEFAFFGNTVVATTCEGNRFGRTDRPLSWNGMIFQGPLQFESGVFEAGLGRRRQLDFHFLWAIK